ncbi:ATP-binding protein [Planctomicrobium piriforme]|uniref:Helicase HerA central domain-containing protein n=1 Tax=Planctomicrobium piriforme TaxID=1576369 RepID=A0A1I3G7Z9_9PLAN|nr:DUF87 domain-containing protein [Planctomicrobium piriforme]SFI19544.1 protein of unknown function DUF87 [Planctomicrobium piriforme]
MYDYEKLGVFYLGRGYDMSSGQTAPEPVLYDAKDLTTHAVIVGMTGSGKTGLGITLLEEAAIDNIPAIVIDPKGDLGNLMLTFPNLQPADFAPWIEPADALRQGQTVDECAAQRATQWKAGLAEWDQPVDRIARLRAAAEVAIYTPGSDAGRQLTVLKSLDAPPQAIRDSSDALRERTSTTVSGLLTLLGIDADPLRSREHILLSNILEQAWKAGRNLDLPQLIREIQSPPFTQIGVMDLESIMPVADRRQLAMTVNNVLASPAFASWTQGERLDIQKLLYTSEGRPRLAIISVAHLSDQERMFFITILLNEFLTWMRSQPGTSSLRALLYMDEVFGYLPPTANPPSKLPLLTLLKQARAFGVGLILATQNPVDLDYKALSNAGTWFLGRLQTERDKARMLDGLEGASATAGVAFDRKRIETILSGLKNRVFLMNNVHEDEPIVFQTRWALSYLRGPLTREQIRSLMEKQKPVATAPATAATPTATSSSPGGTTESAAAPPILPSEIRQRHIPVARNVSRTAGIVYRPAVLGLGRAHYVDSKLGVDVWEDVARLVVLHGDSVAKDPWDDSEAVAVKSLQNDDPAADARYAPLPSECQRATSYKNWTSTFKAYLYRAVTLPLNYCPQLDVYAEPGTSVGDFRAKLVHAARERRDLEIEKLKKKNEPAIARLKEKARKAQQKVEVEQQQANSATMSAAMTFGSSVLGALFGRKKLSAANAGRATTSFRAATRAADQRGDIKRAEANKQAVEEDLTQQEEDFAAQIDQLKESFTEDQLTVETSAVKPRKSDLMIDEVTLVWLPFAVSANGTLTPAFDSELLQS